jgi:hypothetical protein
MATEAKTDLSPICLKKAQAPKPRIVRTIGGKNFAKPTGPNSMRTKAEMLTGYAPPADPSVFKSSQAPKKHAGNCSHSAICEPSGPSFEKCTTPGKKLCQKRQARIKAGKTRRRTERWYCESEFFTI